MIYFCYYTEPKREKSVAHAMKRRGYETFVPMETRVVFRRQAKRREKKPVDVLYPMFVGYMFVGFEDGCEHQWPEPVHRFAAVLSAVKGAGGVVCFTQKAIDKLKEMEKQSVPHVMAAHMRKSFAAGEMVYVVRGPNRDIKAKVAIEEIKGSKARLMLMYFGALRGVDVPLEALEAA